MPDDANPLTPDDESTLCGSPLGRSQATPPDRTGPYKILGTLGEGGMGIVYLAEQVAPLRRRVALKVIKPGMDSKQVLARFESERQALALMNHPNVARIFDAGATEQGLPYFVMEHVAGIPITEYCDKHLLQNRERLELLLPVCEAVHHAHGKGIIHRDIKPSNVLVEIHDGKPVPKVIDFGVAKATNQRLTERTLFTEQGVLIGTPDYMSPEQAEMTALDVDSRTDIYSLGALLYELLVGALPFDPKVIRRAGFAEMQRIIREEDPPTPSSRVKTLGDEASAAAQRRRMDVGSLRKQLRGDLDRIALKALEKDRTRRYASAADLRDDLQRYLRGEPALAGPRSSIATLRKLRRSAPLLLPVFLVVGVIVWIGWSTATVTMTVPSRRLLELKYFDFLLSAVRGSLPPSADVVVVAIDDDSYRTMQRDPGTPWPRGLHADLIRMLKREGARAVAFDVFFEGEGPDPEQDKSLVKALEETCFVVLGGMTESIGDPNVPLLLEPYEPLRKAAAAVGDLALAEEKDGVIRYVSPMSAGRPTLAFAAYEVATGDRSMRGEVARLIDFSGPAHSVPTVSIYKALDPDRYLPADFFLGRIVFVGADQKLPYDKHSTPFPGRTSSVEIHASILASLLRGRWIEPCSTQVEVMVLITMLAAGVGLGLAPWSPRSRVFGSAGLLLLYGLISAAAFIRFRYWLPMIGPLAISELACGTGLWFRRRG